MSHELESTLEVLLKLSFTKTHMDICRLEVAIYSELKLTET